MVQKKKKKRQKTIYPCKKKKTQKIYLQQNQNSPQNLQKTLKKRTKKDDILNCANFQRKKINNLNKELNYQKSLIKTEKDLIYLNGLSLNQWKTITKFSIVGQSNKKKKNFNIAIDHYFNLKSMYKKINSIKNKPSLYSEKKNFRKKNFEKKKFFSTFVPQKLVINQMDPKLMEAYYRNNLDEIEIVPEKKKILKKKKRVLTGKRGLSMKKRVFLEKNKKMRKSKIKKKMKKEKIARKKSKKKKIKPKKKKKVKIEENEYNEIMENNLKFLEKKSFKEISEKIENESSLDESEKIDYEKISEKKKKTEFDEKSEKIIDSKSEINFEDDFIKNKILKKKDLKNFSDIKKNNYTENSVLLKNNEISQNEKISENSKNSEIEKNNFSENSEIDKESENSENSKNELDFEKILKEIPKMENIDDENKIEEFKEKIVKLIFEFEIFGEDEFLNFFELVCKKNEHIDNEFLENIFNDVKKFLYDQFKEVGGELDDEE